MKNKKYPFSSFVLKIIALATMTIDHIGAIVLHNIGLANTSLYLMTRIIGRVAFPLFVFMVVEGVIHTKHPLRYFARLAISGIFIGLALWIGQLIGGEPMITGNIFVDLLAIALVVWLLRQKEYLKLLAIVPALYIFLDFKLNFSVVSPFTSPQYGLYGLTMGVFYYVAYLINEAASKAACGKYGIDFEGYALTRQYRSNANAAASISLLTTNILWYIIFRIDSSWDTVFITFQSLSALTGIILLFYSGKRGYDSKWFRFGTYAYYPFHIILLNLLSYILI